MGRREISLHVGVSLLVLAATTALATSPGVVAAGSPGLPESPDAALTCMAAAIGYEAANEPMPGQKAVAQVILNRMHHPAFPKSICGVVYQGSERRTGCQFSFTCDGSLTRRLSANTWAASRAVATLALLGRLPATVGAATHYHANYVLPRWASALVRVDQIGAHIFYRFPGQSGDSPVALANRATASDAPRHGGGAFRPWGLSPPALSGALAGNQPGAGS